MIPSEYRPIELTDLQRSHRARMEQMGFVIAQRPFRGRDGLRWHCSRVIEGTDRDFSVCLTTGQLTGWGCGTNLTAVEVDRWLSPVDESQSTSASGPVPVEETPGGSENPAGYQSAGFLEVRVLTPSAGLRPKYFATRRDGSQWLLDPNTGIMTCYSLPTWQQYYLRKLGDQFQLVNRDDASVYREGDGTPKPRAKRSAEIRPPVPMPDPCPIQSTAVISGRRQLSLFGD